MLYDVKVYNNTTNFGILATIESWFLEQHFWRFEMFLTSGVPYLFVIFLYLYWMSFQSPSSKFHGGKKRSLVTFYVGALLVVLGGCTKVVRLDIHCWFFFLCNDPQFLAYFVWQAFDFSLRPRSFYSVLECQRHCSTLELRRSFKRLSKLHHPDKRVDNTDSDMFQQLNMAYEVNKFANLWYWCFCLMCTYYYIL